MLLQYIFAQLFNSTGNNTNKMVKQHDTNRGLWWVEKG